MELSTSIDGGTATIALGGHLNTNTAGDLEAALDAAQLLGLDRLGGVGHQLGSPPRLQPRPAGLRVLVYAQKQVDANGGALRIINVADDVREVFEITGLDDIFDIA